jgi:hypothetical protein
VGLGLSGVVALALNDPTVIVVGAVGIIVVLGTALSLSRAGTLHDEIGGDGLVTESTSAATLSPHALEEERTEEIRQLIQARSDRRVRQGLEPLDVDGEIERLLAAERGPGQHDPAVIEEIRQLAVARNARRERRGEAPLDVDDEVRRTLQELDQ